MIDVVLAPPLAPQVFIPKPEPVPLPRLDDTDLRIIETVRDVGPVKTWSLLNILADDSGLGRSENRDSRRALWDRVRRLKCLGLIFGRGRNEVAATKTERQPARPRPRRRKPCVAQLAPVKAVSARNLFDQAPPMQIEHPLGADVAVGNEALTAASKAAKETESAITQEQASEAGRALAELPRCQQRKWTGWLRGEHCWRGRLLLLPNDEIAPLIWCSRGRVLLQNVKDLSFRDWMLWGARRAHEVAVWKTPAARLLGSLKAGKTERKSELKAASARRNGRMPCRPGRSRGRPRRNAAHCAAPLINLATS